MDVRKGIGAASVLLAAGVACGQVKTVARTAANNQEFGQRATDNAISVGAEAIVITSNHGISLFNKAGTKLVAFKMSDAGFPFIRTETDPAPVGADAPSRYFDGRTEYDHAHDRQWIIYSETNDEDASTDDGDISSLHVAVSKDPAAFPPAKPTLETLTNDHWWYYTGPASNPGNGDTAFDLQDDNFDRYYAGGPHDPFPEQPVPFDPDDYEGISLLDLPTIAVDERAFYVTAFGFFTPDGFGTPFELFQNIFIIPIDFEEGGISKSMLDGDKPPAQQIVSLRLRDLPIDPASPLPPIKEHEPDFHLRHFAVQEPFPYTEAENAQLFVSVSVGSEEQTGIRVAGLWFDETAIPDGEWIYTQHIVDDTGGAEDYPLAEVDVGAAGLAFFYAPSGGYQIETPDPAFNPRPAGAFISSAVLAKDGQGELRLFIAHHVAPSDGASTPQAEQRYAVQWYVIDPDLGTSPDNFRIIQNPPIWNPTLVESGRIETNGADDGDCYNPSIGVTRQGAAYIEYSFTNDVTWPQIRRVKLTSDYSAVATNVLLQAGPVNYIYEDQLGTGDPDDAWQDFSDMQHDPFLCKLWSTHTLVHDPGIPAGTVDLTYLRDLWLFENRYTTLCFTPDMNANGMVEPEDALLYNDYYAAQDDRADANADGAVDPTDAAIFLDAYAAGVP